MPGGLPTVFTQIRSDVVTFAAVPEVIDASVQALLVPLLCRGVHDLQRLRCAQEDLDDQSAAVGAELGDVVQQAILSFRRQEREQAFGDPPAGAAGAADHLPPGPARAGAA